MKSCKTNKYLFIYIINSSIHFMKRTPRRQLQLTWLITCIQPLLSQNLLDPRRNALIKIFYFRNWNHGSSQDLQSSSILVGLQLETLTFKSAYKGSIILISVDTGGQSLITQILELSRKEVTSLDWWHSAPSCCVLCILVTNLSSKRFHIQLNASERDTVWGFMCLLLLWCPNH